MIKFVFFIILCLFATSSYSQNWYSKIVDRNNKNEQGASLILEGQTAYLRAYGTNATQNKLMSMLGVNEVNFDNILDIKSFENIQAGLSIINESNCFILPSQNTPTKVSLTVTSISKSDYSIIDSIDLTLNLPNYESYTIKKGLKYKEKYWICGQVLNNQNYIPYSGWYNFQESAVIFVLNNQLEMDTALIIPPVTGAYLEIDDIEIGADSILYITFRERYLRTDVAEPYLEDRYVIHGYNKQYQKIFEWISPDRLLISQIQLAASKDSTLYFNYEKNYRQYLVAMKNNGQILWETPFEQLIGVNEYILKSLIVADNGDIIGCGIFSSAANQLGNSGLIFRITADGIFKWKKAIRINKGFDLTLINRDWWPYESALNDIVELDNGDLFAVGHIIRFVGLDSVPTHNYDIWIVRTSSEGCLWDNCDSTQEIVIRPNYIPIVSDKNEWVVDYIQPAFPQEIRHYTFAKDSLQIGNKYYKNLIYNKNISGGVWETTNEFFREENGKVYKIGGASGQIERLLYDMNFGIGDTLVPNSDIEQSNREISNVGFINLLDNLPRKTAILTSSGCGVNSTWVEGMGDTERLFWTETICSLIDQDGPLQPIRCFSTNGQLLYLRPDLNGCHTSNTIEFNDIRVSISPNPANNYLDIKLLDNKNAKSISIFNNIGQLILTYSPENSGEYILDISNLVNGFYSVLINFDDSISLPFSFVVHK